MMQNSNSRDYNLKCITKQESSILKQVVIEHNFIETVSTNNISVQRGDGAKRWQRGVKKKKKKIKWLNDNYKRKVADSTGQKKLISMESDWQWQGIFCIYFVQKIN